MFMELYKVSRLVMYRNSCSMDLGHDKCCGGGLDKISLLMGLETKRKEKGKEEQDRFGICKFPPPPPIFPPPMLTWQDLDSTHGMVMSKEKERWLGEGIFSSCQQRDHIWEE